MSDLSDLIKTVDRVRSLKAAKYSNYALTEAGKQKAEEYGGDGKEWEALNYLNDNGASTLREVAEGIHMREKETKVLLERLIAKQRVIKVAQR